jgi:hypothetical protein
MKITSFDFDGTFFHTPLPEVGKPVFKAKTGHDWPYRGWWGRKESLDLDIFDIPINKFVLNKFVKHEQDGDYNILATGRLKFMTKSVLDVLDQHGLSEKFDEIHLNPGMDTFLFKANLYENLINKKKPSEFIMYDDREEHLYKFEVWAKKQPCKIVIFDVVNKIEKSFNKGV